MPTNRLKGKSKNNNKLKDKSFNKEAKNKQDEKFIISFQLMDRNQGQNFENWHDENLLVKMLNRIRDCCCKTIEENIKDGYFKVYGEFPLCSEFRKPSHISEDSQWACLHIQGKECLAGTVYENIFYVVFLDKDHIFWPTQKKHT